jgi:hypothetical protein
MTVPLVQPLRASALAGIVHASRPPACGERARSEHPDVADAGAGAADRE